MKYNRRRESLQTTLAYVFSDGWEEHVYRIDTKGHCNCDGFRNPQKGCKHTSALADGIGHALETGHWQCHVDLVMTPWSAEELGLTEVQGLSIRPTP